MTEITADEYRVAAKVLRSKCNRPGFPYSVRSAVEHCEGEAVRLDGEAAREAAREAEVEELARLWWESYRAGFIAVDPSRAISTWDRLSRPENAAMRAGHLCAARAVLDRVSAGKTAPRSWPSLNQVPHDVAVTDNAGDRWEFSDGGWRYQLVGETGWSLKYTAGMELYGPFTEVSV